MPKRNINIQDGFLFQNLKESQLLEVELMNGSSAVGTLTRFDRFALVLESDGKEFLIYKHAISRIFAAASGE